MAITHEPLLNHGKQTLNFHMIIWFAATLTATILSVYFLVPNVIKTFQPHFPVSPHTCLKAYNQEECLSIVSEVVSDGANTNALLQGLLQRHVLDVKNAVAVTKQHIKNQMIDQFEQVTLLDLSIDLVTDSILAVQSCTNHSFAYADAQAWLSGVLTNHETCFDGLSVSKKALIKKDMQHLISRAKASLAVLAQVKAEEEMLNSLSAKLMLPFWVTMRDRNFLEISAKDIEADLVVGKNGTGDYETLAEAIEAAPNKSKTRFVIHVKEGIYEENVQVIKNKKNLMIIGDGMNLTIITGSLNVADNASTTTFRTATLAAVGEGFILQDICIQNTAGPEKHQAVALRVGADRAVINRCLIDAYQDTLYAHALRQFYRDCYITGTVDFIFGNAAVVLQNCKLVARKPMTGQKNMVTAQGRTDLNQPTGTSIQNCNITASDDLEPVQTQYPTYLGRPWKEFARVVVMESYISDIINPAGWSEWRDDFALNTCYIGEYMNEGPGAGLSKRVNWTGYHKITNEAEAMNFTVAELIQGGEWLPYTGVAFTEGLTNYSSNSTPTIIPDYLNIVSSV